MTDDVREIGELVRRLVGADTLTGASLRGADLTSTKLVGAYILGAYLEKSVLFGADLSKVQMSPAVAWQGTVHLEGAVANKATIWPNGWDQQRAEAGGMGV